MMKRAILAAVVIVMGSSWALAGPPVKSRIPDTAKWAVHLDIEAITNSTVAGGILEMISAEDSPVPKERVEKAVKFWEILGKVKSLTLFGPTCKETDAVAVADHRYEEAAVKKVLEITDASPTQTYGDHTIYTFTPKKKRKRAKQPGKRLACFHSDGIVVAGADLARVKEVLDLLDGKGKPLTKDNPLTEMLTPAKGSFVVAAAVDLDKIAKKVPAKKNARRRKRHVALLKKCRSARFELGEANENVYAALSVTMATEEDAANIHMMALGIRAMVLFGHEEENNGKAGKIAEMVKATEISHKDKSVSVSIKYPVEDVLTLMQTAMKEKHAAGKAEKEDDSQ